MTGRRFDAVFIDFYGTIAAGDRAAVEEACLRIVRELDVPMTAEDFAVRWGERFFATIENSNLDDFKTLHDCEMVSLKETLADLVGEVDPAPFVETLEAYWRNPPLHDDALDALERIDLPVCCVSNADTDAIEAAFARHDLRFDATVTSEGARCYKPHESIFLQAAGLLDVDLTRVLHVGDSLHSDIGGAAKLGITTAWICREDRIHDIGQHEADHTIDTLSAISDLIAD